MAQKRLRECNSAMDLPLNGRPNISEVVVNKMQIAFQRSP